MLTAETSPIEAQYFAGVLPGTPELRRLVQDTPSGVFTRPDLTAAWEKTLVPMAEDGRLSPAAAAVALQRAGHGDLVLELAAIPPASETVLRAWLSDLRRLAHARTLAQAAAAAASGLKHKADPMAVAADLRQLLDYAGRQYAPSETPSMAAAVSAWESWVLELRHRRETGKGLATGIAALDQHLELWPSLGLILARTNHGKTALALQMALNQAKAGSGVLFATLEQPQAQVVSRLLCLSTRLGWRTVTGDDRTWRPDEAAAMETALGWFRQCDRLALLDGRHTADSVLATAARLRDKGRCDILYIDQMSRLDHQQQARETKEQAWTRTSNRLARGWQELGIPVVLLAQLNVKSGEEHPTPSAAHVKDCGSIVEDACWALLLDRPEGDQERFSRMKPEHQDKLRGKVLVSCVKDRGSNMGGTWQEALPIDRVSGYLGPLREAPTVGDAAAEEWARRGAQP